MVKLGIIGAMDEEIETLLSAMMERESVERAGSIFHTGKLENTKVVVVKCGIGKVNAALCAQILCSCYQITHLVNTGIAGSLNANIDIGDIVLSVDTIEHDMDAVAFGYPLGQIPRMDTLAFKADDKLRALAKKVCQEVVPEISVFEGRVVSGDQFISDKKKKDWLVENFDGYCT